ncbi:MAG: hypothetical protein JRE63_01830 [Deltaproteobacteria bacterium]|jgi:hypothetical protein|nr:hypothetical protein [Deltaproteobacteria bacterium]
MKLMILLTVLISSLASGSVMASEFMIYPNQGQSNDQMEQDKFQCYSWAKQQSGFDPMAPPTATEAPPPREAQQGGVVRGGVRGALVGTAAGAIAGDTGKGAAIGAASGALIGGMRRNDQVRREKQSRQQWEQQQVQQYTQSRSDYNRAYAACLEGRGYTVR